MLPARGLCAHLRVTVAPKIIKQGDAFVVSVRGAASSALPTATVGQNEIRFSRCGERCFVGIGAVSYDTRAGLYRIKVMAGKQKRNIQLTVKKAAFRTASLSLPHEMTSISPTDLEIIREENILLNSLFLTVSERAWDGPFMIPVDNTIVMPFGTKRIMNKTWSSVHRGVDIRGSEGDEVRASNNGRVALARSLFLGGNTVILDHGQGIHTIYMHLSRTHVVTGDSVSKGDVIGFIGSTGRATGPHLHFGIKISNISVNPLSVLELRL